jgi:lipopolysaccharide transport system ATP-binding protein
MCSRSGFSISVFYMSDITISVDGLSKKYFIGEYARYYSLRETLNRVFTAPFRRLQAGYKKPAEQSSIWALKDVSFDIKRGEVVGVIGRNGAGKSTLLKILSRITDPTEGVAKIQGRVTSLLEVGTGFHPELTGRENVFLNGAIMGMKRFEIRQKFDEIVAFAEVETFIDTQVKHYSSGMYLRLAFSVAAHLESEVLMVDEVLAVGDVAFQNRCLGKIEGVVNEGRTVLFVSHNMPAIHRLCSRAIVLHEGALIQDGAVSVAVNEYLKTSLGSLEGERSWPDLEQAPGDDVVRLTGIRTKNKDGVVCQEFDVRESFEVEFDYTVLKDGFLLGSCFEFLNPIGHPIIVSFDNCIRGPWGKQDPVPAGNYRSTCIVPGDLLQEGSMMVSLRIFTPPSEPEASYHVREIQVLSFSIIDTMDPGGVRGSYPFDWGGPSLRPRLDWATEKVS